MKPVTHHEEMELRARSIELRAAEGESRTVEGYAALFDSPTDMGWYDEVIARGAFDEADMTDVRCLFNHDANKVLARTASGTMTLTTDERGLKFRFTFGDATHDEDVYKMVKRGDVSQCSFAFRVDEQTWTYTEDAPDLRTITRIKAVYDVSLVTYPAYPDTSVALRSKQAQETPTPKNIHSPEFLDDVKFLTTRLSAV